MTAAIRSKIIFEALSQVNPAAADALKTAFNDNLRLANAVGMAELKRALGMDDRFGPKVRCA